MKSMCDTAAEAGIVQTTETSLYGASVRHGALRSSTRRGRRVYRSLLLALAVGIVLPASIALAEGDPVAGREKAYTCLGCHWVKHYINSYPTYHVPRIAGQHKDYLAAALQAYRSKTRPHPTMQANASLLSDQDIQDISAWFASQGAN